MHLQVPTLWASAAYPSLKPLSSWVKDLTFRIHFIEVYTYIDVCYIQCSYAVVLFTPTALDRERPPQIFLAFRVFLPTRISDRYPAESRTKIQPPHRWAELQVHPSTSILSPRRLLQCSHEKWGEQNRRYSGQAWGVSHTLTQQYM